MSKLATLLVRDIFEKFGWRMVALAVLMVASGIAEGFGMAMLYPLLNLIGMGGSQPQNNSYIFDKIMSTVGVRPDSLLSGVLFIILIFLAQNLLFLGQGWLAARLQHRYVATWRQTLFRSYMESRWAFFVNSRSGELINTLIGEVDRLGGSFYLVIQLVSASFVTLIYLSLSLYVSWQVTAIIIATGLVLSLLTAGLVKRGYWIGKQISEATGSLQTTAQEFIGGAKVIKATATEMIAGRRLDDVVGRLQSLYFWSSFQPTILKALFEFTSIALLCTLIFAGTTYLNIEPAVIVVISAIFFRLVPRIFSLQQNIQLFVVYLPAISSILGLYEKAAGQQETYTEVRDPEQVLAGNVQISFAGVSLHYSDKQVLDRVTIDIPAGRMIGIVGSSGAGKSTLVDCLLRLTAPSAGTIRINGRPIESLPLREWRRSIGYVSQESFLFHESVGSNITWGTPAGKDALIAAARKANADEFISKMPEGYDTIVGDRGVRLSGGQKQRIGLARALINNPALLILDEATSALDSESEQQVLAAIEELRGQMTIISIAHRLATVKNADYLYVLEEGRVVEHGRWDDLLKNNGRLAELWRLQSSDTTDN